MYDIANSLLLPLGCLSLQLTVYIQCTGKRSYLYPVSIFIYLCVTGNLTEFPHLYRTFISQHVSSLKVTTAIF